jgi:hypothetical protein
VLTFSPEKANRYSIFACLPPPGLRAVQHSLYLRGSTMNAGRIYVLQPGRITQCRTYAELMEHEGPFRELASQLLAW